VANIHADGIFESAATYQLRWFGFNDEFLLLEILDARSYISMRSPRRGANAKSLTTGLSTNLEGQLHGGGEAARVLRYGV
jgi:hypothetical protein